MVQNERDFLKNYKWGLLKYPQQMFDWNEDGSTDWTQMMMMTLLFVWLRWIGPMTNPMDKSDGKMIDDHTTESSRGRMQQNCFGESLNLALPKYNL